MATAKKASAKKAPVKKVAAKKAAPKAAARKAAPKTAAKKAPEFSLKNSAEKAVNIYLGVIGAGFDRVQSNLETARKDLGVARKENEKRMKKFESRGAKLRKEMRSNVEKIETPEFDNVVEDVKDQISKLQDQLEDVVENVKEKLTPAKAA
ncbi:MAG: hypothetical protein ABJ308_03855 [Halieaceae bacterium]